VLGAGVKIDIVAEDGKVKPGDQGAMALLSNSTETFTRRIKERPRTTILSR